MSKRRCKDCEGFHTDYVIGCCYLFEGEATGDCKEVAIIINQCAVCTSDPVSGRDRIGDVLFKCSNRDCFVGKEINAFSYEEAVKLWNELNPTEAEILLPKPRENQDIRFLGLLGLVALTAVLLLDLGGWVAWFTALGMYIVMCWSAYRHDNRVEYPRTSKRYNGGYDHFDPST